jgi:hypothetical protein
MTQKYAIEVDFDVYRALWLRRTSEETTFNDVLRELLLIGDPGQVPEPKPPSPPTPPDPLRGTGYQLRGHWRAARTAKEVLVGVLRDLAREDPQFPSRLAAIANARGRKRRYVAQRPEDLYPGRPDLAHESAEFTSGWYVGTNISNGEKTRLLQDACQPAGLRWGEDLVVTLG